MSVRVDRAKRFSYSEIYFDNSLKIGASHIEPRAIAKERHSTCSGDSRILGFGSNQAQIAPSSPAGERRLLRGVDTYGNLMRMAIEQARLFRRGGKISPAGYELIICVGLPK